MILMGGNILNSRFKIEKKDICIKDGKIFFNSSDSLNFSDSNNLKILDITGLTVLPGLIDLHIHGYKETDIAAAGKKELDALCGDLVKEGTTSFLCGLAADSHENTLNSLKVISKYRKGQSAGAEILGFNMEGPYLSKEKKGAIPEKYIRKADVNELNEFCKAADNQIKIMTIAPEITENQDCIHELTERNIVPAIGHSNATASETEKSMKHGISHATHLFNAMRGISHREPGVPGAVFDSDITAELICDGFHINEKIIRMTYRLLGKERLILISDNGQMSGSADGKYVVNGITTIIKDGTCKLPDGTLKGNYSSLFECVKRAIKFGIPFEDAVYCATYSPAKRIGVEQKKGSIDIGKDADLLIVDDNLTLRHVIKNGKLLK